MTTRDRDHAAIPAAEEHTDPRPFARKARLTGSLTVEERALIAAATVPSRAEQKRSLADFARAAKAGREGWIKR